MKKLISLILCLVMMLSVFAVAPIVTNAVNKDVQITAAKFVYDNLEYLISIDGTAQVYSHIGYPVSVAIPEYVNGYKVTSIGNSAFAYSESLSYVYIPETVTQIQFFLAQIIPAL